MFGALLAVRGHVGDQMVLQDWGTLKQVTDKNAILHLLTVVNKGVDCWIQVFDSAAGATGTPREYPLPQDSVLSLSNMRFLNGIYVRAVTSADGSTPIVGNHVQIDAHYMTHPLV
jgi:hypothetical protein